MKRFLEKRLKIYEHEVSQFTWLAVIFFAVFFVTAIFRNYVDTAFLKRYGPEYIPWMLAISAVITIVVLGFADRIARRFSDAYLMIGFLLSYAAGAAICFVMVKSAFSIVYPILYQLMHLLDSILLVYLWNITGDLFDARQGKRIFPLVTAAQVLGTTVGSFLTRPITYRIGEDAALLVFALVFLLTALFMARTSQKFVGPPKPKTTSLSKDVGRRSLSEVPGIVREFPIVRFLIICGLIPNMLLPIFSYQFSVIANHSFSSEQALITFLSVFRGSTTLLTFVVLFFVGRLYSTMGLPNASLVQPINFTVIFGALSFFFNIYVAAYGQFTTILIQRSIAGPVNKILFNVIPKTLQAWGRTFIRGTVLKVGMLTGSLLMIFLKPVLDPRDFAYIAFVLATYWVFETLRFRKEYKRLLKQVISEGKIDFDQTEAVQVFDTSLASTEIGSDSLAARADEMTPEVTRKPTPIAAEVAIKLLDDDNPLTRAEAATSLIQTREVLAVRRLVQLLEDKDDEVRKAAIEALVSYGNAIQPFLEASLIEAHPRTKRGILEIMRLSGLTGFEMIPFLGQELAQAYASLIAIRMLGSMNNSLSVKMLREHLQQANEETLSAIFYALWVYHADMRLMYRALKSENASIAVELVETSIQKELGQYLIPLIEDIPLDEKIQRGKKLFPFMRFETEDRIITFLAQSEDPITRMLTLFLIGEEAPKSSFAPVVQSRINDGFSHVRELAHYALERTMNKAAPMPDIINMINKLGTFPIFEGMGVRELHAIASVVTEEHFKPTEIMIKEGEANSSIYLVVSGKVTIFKGYETEHQQEKATVGEGSFFGELSLFTRMPPNATCVATTDTEAYILGHNQFQEIMEVYPQIGINLCRFFTTRLRQTSY